MLEICFSTSPSTSTPHNKSFWEVKWTGRVEGGYWKKWWIFQLKRPDVAWIPQVHLCFYRLKLPWWVFVRSLVYGYKNVKKYMYLKVLMKVQVSLGEFIFPFLSYLTIFTPRGHFLFIPLVLLGFLEAFNKVPWVQITLRGAKKSTENPDIPFLIGWCK